MDGLIDFRMLLSGASFLFTTYFWFVKARKERPNLAFHQLCDYRVSCRRHPEEKHLKRLCLQQLDTGGVLIMNHSTRQNAIVVFDCFLETDQGEIQGDWGYSGDDKPAMEHRPRNHHGVQPRMFLRCARRLRNTRQSKLPNGVHHGKRLQVLPPLHPQGAPITLNRINLPGAPRGVRV